MPFSARNSVAIVPSTAVAVALVAASAIFFQRRKSFDDEPTRCAKYSCECGKVQANISIPPANYRYIEIPSFQCLCNDCVDFVNKVQSHSASNNNRLLSPGIETLVLLDSEIELTSGADLIRSMKLSKNTENRRIYSTCCATPMAISIMGTGVTLIYTKNLNDENSSMPELKPIVCFNVNGKIKQQDYPELKLSQGQLAPKAILYCLAHMASIALLGKKDGQGKGFPMEGEIDVGIDSIDSRFESQ